MALLTPDLLTPRAEAFFRRHRPIPVVSDFAAAEFASPLARRFRMREIDRNTAQASFDHLGQWLTRVAERVYLDTGAVEDANGFRRRLDFGLRTPDALKIADAAAAWALPQRGRRLGHL